jgi:hypothetical protein
MRGVLEQRNSNHSGVALVISVSLSLASVLHYIRNMFLAKSQKLFSAI